MKLYSDEALMVGGVYSVLSTPFLILKTPFSEQIGIYLFFLFIISIFLLYWPKFSLFICEQKKNFPQISYYLCAIGWVPYFAILGIIAILGLSVFLAWDDYIINTVANIFSIISTWSLPFCIAFAYFLKLAKKTP